MPTQPDDRARSWLATRYVLGLTFAQLVTAAEVAAVIISLGNQADGATLARFGSLPFVIGLSVAGFAATIVGGYWTITPCLRWFRAGLTPTERQRQDAINLLRRQSLLLTATWLVAGAALVIAHLDGGAGTILLLVVATLFGATSSTSSSMLFTMRGFRPIVAAAAAAGANGESTTRATAPGVVARLVLMWIVNGVFPSVAVATLVVCHAYGWFVPQTASLVVPIVVMTVVSAALGLRALILVSRSISDPIGDVVDAMAEVERGSIGRTVDVYEQSEIGRLQHGFNRMVAGLTERDRLRDLFGRQAVEEGTTLTGEEREVAILFIDLTDSTRLAASRPPHEVAGVLNAFFRIVVAAVDARGGLINKFQGDAALAVFGAPTRLDGFSSAALATARALGAELQALPEVDFGIGISAGAVFAGNIGAENRYEYTVIGDPVNEAARLADAAKITPTRALASLAAIDRAGVDEQMRWSSDGVLSLRGRAEPTHVFRPCTVDPERHAARP